MAICFHTFLSPLLILSSLFKVQLLYSMSNSKQTDISNEAAQQAPPALVARNNGVVPCLRDLLPLPGQLPLLQRRQHIPTSLGWPVIDAHVHIFPDRLMDAVQR
jgi:hypothetical protein